MKFLALALLLCGVTLGGTGPGWAAEFACPGTLAVRPAQSVAAPPGWRATDEPEQHYLRGARLFDGEPKDLADLIPERGGWDLGANQGRGYTLVCQYEGTEAVLEAKVPDGLRRCQMSRQKVNWHGVRFGRTVTDGTEVRVVCK